MKRHHRLSKTDQKRAGKQAAKNPNWVNVVAASIYKSKRASFSRGAASECRQIVKDGKPIEGAN